MSLRYEVSHRQSYTVVRVEGEPTLEDFIRMIQAVGVESAGWPSPRMLIDLRGIRTMRTFTEHYAIGEEVGRRLGHLRAVASVVPADRLTRASEKMARAAGVNVTVFTSEAEAIAWLSQGGAAPAAA